MTTTTRRNVFRLGRRLPFICGLVTAAAAGAAPGQTFPPPVVHSDVRWEGTVHIDRDVSIMAATVEVSPGTIIRFTGGAGSAEGPAIVLNSPAVAASTTRSAHLVLQGTPEEPIIVETPAGHPPGAIAAGPDTASSITARHVIFRRLGAPRGQGQARPAVFVQLASPANDLWLADCVFEDCGPIHAEAIGPAASIDIRRCTFRRTVGDRWLVLIGTGTGVKVVADNVADAGVMILCPQVLAAGNVLVGETASIAVVGDDLAGLAIRGNYVHCTTAEDRGRYAVRCTATAAVLENNVLIGGTYVVEAAPSRVSGNVLIGCRGLRGRFDLPGLRTGLGEVETTTHYLIAEPPAEGSIRDNLFLGPAYAALMVTPGVRRLEVVGNVFDGWGIGRAAVRLPSGDASPTVRFEGNLCGGYRQGCVIAQATDAGVEAGPADAGLPPGFAPLPAIQAAASRSAMDLEPRMFCGTMTAAEVRRLWMECYRRVP